MNKARRIARKYADTCFPLRPVWALGRPGYEKMTVAQLQRIARRKGLKVTTKMNKTTLINNLLEATDA